MSRVSKVTVIGLGNVLVGDDAFGPYVARQIDARYAMPDGVEVIDVGTPGGDLGPHIAGVDALIVIDTVRSTAPPGTVICYRGDELLARGPTPRTNPHQPSLVDTLFFLALQDLAPEEVLLVGVVPDRYDTGAPLSPPVRLAVHEAMVLVISELERLGFVPAVRDLPQDPQIWWEQPAVTAGTSTSISPAAAGTAGSSRDVRAGVGAHVSEHVREKEG
jgi:hydrogenase maturation protease